MSAATSPYPNPLIAGFYPDPSVVRVGDDYYLATSTFEYLPGCPGVPQPRPGRLDADRPRRGAARPARLGGRADQRRRLGADHPAPRRHVLRRGHRRDGPRHADLHRRPTRGSVERRHRRRRASTASTRTSPGTSDGTATSPTPAWTPPRASRCAAGTAASCRSPSTWRPESRCRDPVSLWSGTGLKFPEAPHLYQHDGTWYLMIAEGGTERGHGISVARGPSRVRPVRGRPGQPGGVRAQHRPADPEHRARRPGADPGRRLGRRHARHAPERRAPRRSRALGRETFITPARWTDGWLEIDPVELAPAAGRGRRGRRLRRRPAVARSGSRCAGIPAELGDARPAGALVLHGDGSTLDDLRPVFVGRRQQHQQVRGVRRRRRPAPGRAGSRCGSTSCTTTRSRSATASVTARAAVAGIRQEWTPPAPSESVTLHLDCVPPTGTSMLDLLTSDLVVLGVTDADGERPGRPRRASTAATSRRRRRRRSPAG